MKTMIKNGTKENNSRIKLLSARGMTVIALLSAISVVLMLFDFPLWFAPSFYEIDLSEVPVLIGAFALGPIAGVLIELIKILLNLMINGTKTAFIGEAANFLIGCALVVPAAWVYHLGKTKKHALIGLILGTFVMVTMGSLMNAFVLLPTYARVYGMPVDALIAMGTSVNSSINSMSSFVLLAVAPFNLIKGVAVSVLTMLIYKYVSPIIKGYH